jgi:hypothetical protein
METPIRNIINNNDPVRQAYDNVYVLLRIKK